METLANPTPTQNQHIEAVASVETAQAAATPEQAFGERLYNFARFVVGFEHKDPNSGRLSDFSHTHKLGNPAGAYNEHPAVPPRPRWYGN